MAHFSDLPLDLLPYILDYLSKSEYDALVRVCQSLHKEVLPYLYRDISFTATKSRGCARKLAFLLRTLLEQPSLASHVLKFRLYGPHAYWNRYNPWSDNEDTWTMNLWGLEGCTTLSKAQIILVSNQFYQFVDEEVHRSLAQFRGRSKDALAILILTRLTELNTLELGDGFLRYSLFLPQIIKRAIRFFPKLTRVILGDRRRDTNNAVAYMDLDLIRPIFYLPTVETFEWTMSEPWDFWWNGPRPPRCESLTKLHLFRSNISRKILSFFLAATPNLKVLHYRQEIVFSRTMVGDTNRFTDLSELNFALRNVTKTLEDIKLSLQLGPGSLCYNQIFERGLQFPAVQGTLYILREMEQLRKIEIPILFLLGWAPDFAARLHEVLPSGITELTLRDDFVDLCPWATGMNCHKKVGLIGEYMENRSVYAPHLRKFMIRISGMKKEGWLVEAVYDLKLRIYGYEVLQYIYHPEGSDVDMYWWLFGE
ncbi:hypothetical protein CC78DRAFT_178516 [Lojkania enalia]|uniref:F-box domain-containing protein n=1 Tax=Lojkania enalia TaxID=147567 RepID=A0A9P4JWI7_9PLEO|nr:hypothetical protein CC78DRAFT_178516 [Didymosphaeria enalia]